MSSFPHDTLLNATYLDENKLCIMRVKDAASHIHDHEFLELAYVLQGSAMHQMGTHTTKLQAGDFILVELGSLHGYHDGQDLEIINCLFAPEYVDHALISCPSLQALLSTSYRQFGANVYGRSPVDCILHDQDGRIRPLLLDMEHEYIARQPGYLEMIRCRLVEILVQAIRMLPSETLKRCHPVIAAILEDIHIHWNQPFSLEELGQRFGYTPQYLSGLFHKEVGCSLTTYLQRIRIDHACQLLIKTNDTLANIACQVGFEDPKHLSTLCRRYMGMTPRMLRKAYRTDD